MSRWAASAFAAAAALALPAAAAPEAVFQKGFTLGGWSRDDQRLGHHRAAPHHGLVRVDEYPMKLIQLIRDGRPAIFPAALISISGITSQDQNMVIAILRTEQVSGGPTGYPYSAVRLLTIHARRPAVIIVRLPYDLESGTYKVAALHRFVRDRSLRDLLADPIGALARGRVRPLFVMGSNVMDLEVTGPTHR